MHSYIFIIVLFFTTASPLLAGKSSSPMSSPILSLNSDELQSDLLLPQTSVLQTPLKQLETPKLQKEEFPNFVKESPFYVARSKLSPHDLDNKNIHLNGALQHYVHQSLKFTDDNTLTEEIKLLERLPVDERTESLLLINTKREALSKLAIPPSRLLEFLLLVSREKRTLDFVESVFSLLKDPLSQEFLSEVHIFSQSSAKVPTLSKAQNFFQSGGKVSKNMMNLIIVCNRLPSDDAFLSKLREFGAIQRSRILAVMASSKEKLSPNIPLETLIVLKTFDAKDRTEETIQNLLTVLNHQVGAQKKPLTSTMLLNCLKKHKKESWLRVLNRLVVQTQQL